MVRLHLSKNKGGAEGLVLGGTVLEQDGAQLPEEDAH